MKQVVWQFAARELHVIMQLVTVEVMGVESPGVVGATLGVVACASRINSSAEACCAPPYIAAAITMIARARMIHLRSKVSKYDS
jgi:hypothetical protein